MARKKPLSQTPAAIRARAKRKADKARHIQDLSDLGITYVPKKKGRKAKPKAPKVRTARGQQIYETRLRKQAEGHTYKSTKGRKRTEEEKEATRQKKLLKAVLKSLNETNVGSASGF